MSVAAPPLDPTRVVFVGGLHRSGTSPLARALASHPDASGMHDTGVPEDEGQHLQSVYPPALAHGGAGRFALDPTAHLVEQDADADAAARLAASWGPHWDLDRPVLVEKSPPNLVRMRYLQAVFPGARFVVVVRHPLVVSLAQHKGRRPSLHHLLRHWIRAHEVCAADAPAVTDLRVVAYEELTARPDEVLDDLFAWLGLASHRVPAELRLEPRDERYRQRWADLRRSPLWGPMTRALVELHGARTAALGYRLDRWTPDVDVLARRFGSRLRP